MSSKKEGFHFSITQINWMLNIVTYLNEMLKGKWAIFNFAKLFVVNIPKEPTNQAFVNFSSDPNLKKKDLILILNSVSGDDKSCVKFTPPVGENVAINLGSNGFPIVNSLRQFLQMRNYILRQTHLIWFEFPSQVMNWRETLEFPPEVPISEPATKTILRWALQ